MKGRYELPRLVGQSYSILDTSSYKRQRTGYTGLFLCHSIQPFLIETARNLKMVMNTGVKESTRG